MLPPVHGAYTATRGARSGARVASRSPRAPPAVVIVRLNSRAGSSGVAVERERRVGAVDLHAAEREPIGEMRRFARVMLPLDRDDDRFDGAGPPLLDRLTIDPVDLTQNRFAPIGRGVEQRHCRDQLV